MRAGNYPKPIELQDATGISVVDHLISKPVGNCGSADYNGCTSNRPKGFNDQAFGIAIVGLGILRDHSKGTAQGHFSIDELAQCMGESSIYSRLGWIDRL